MSCGNQDGFGQGEATHPDAHLTEWLSRLDAKLDMILDFSKQSHRPPSQQGPQGDASPEPLRPVLADFAKPVGSRAWKKELLTRGLAKQDSRSAAEPDYSSAEESENGNQHDGHEAAPKKERGRRSSLEPPASKKLTSVSNSNLRSSHHLGWLHKVVVSQRFDTFVTMMICGNSFLIGVQVQNSATATSDADTWWYQYVEYAFTGIFSAELLMRLLVQGREFFTNQIERPWNLFDFLLVCTSWIDLYLSLLLGNDLPGSSSFISKLGRAVRIMRVMRIIRTVRHLSQLRLLLRQLMSSLLSLAWVMLILLATIYVFAVILTQGAIDHLNQSGHASDDDEGLRKHWGSLFGSMYTLFQCISGGISWGEASTLMRGPGVVLEAIVVLYVFFSVFALINIVNGVFVEGAIALANRDREAMIHKQKSEKASNELHLVDLLMAIDQNGDQQISFEEFCTSLEDTAIRDYFAALQIEVLDAKAFFRLLDSDGSGEVNVVEFVTGMMKLKGDAKSVDVHMLAYQNKMTINMVCGLADFLHESFSQSPHPALSSIDA